MRLSDEQLQEILKRRERWERDGLVKVRQHVCKDDVDPALREDGRPRTGPRGRPRKRQQGDLVQASSAVKSVIPRERSELEILLEQQIVLARLPAPLVDQPFLIGRKHRLDFQWRERQIGVEVQGMVHRIKGRFKADIEKRALALLAGWRVLEVDGESIRSGRALTWLQQLLEAA